MGFQKLNKKGLYLSKAFFAVVVVSIAIIAVGVVVGEWGERYDSGITYDLREYEALDEFSEEAGTQRESMTSSSDDPGTGDFEGKIFSGGYGILGKIFLPFRIIFNMFESLENRFGLPGYVSEGFLTLMVFALVFTILSVIFRRGKS